MNSLLETTGKLSGARPLHQFGGLRPRELIANWLLCVGFNDDCGTPERLTFTSDPLGGDGLLYDTVTGATFPTEHVYIRTLARGNSADLEALILDKINEKRKKGGPAYASGKTLVVFLNAGGGRAWRPNKVAKQLPNPLYFEVVWVVGLHQIEAGKHAYSVAQLKITDGAAPSWLIRIADDFDYWKVERLQ